MLPAHTFGVSLPSATAPCVALPPASLQSCSRLRLLRLLLLTGLCWTATGAPAQTANGTPRHGPLLQVALNTDIRGTNPGVNRDSNTDGVLHHVVEALVGYAEDLTIQPVVAESFRIEDAGRTYVFTLRDGIRFHNGAPVTSREIQWSWQRYLDPATQWKCTGWFRGGEDENSGKASVITAIEAPDERTVVFRLAEPSTLFLDRMANVQCISAILHPDSVGADGQWIAPVGTGPYKLATWKHSEYVELERFDGYLPRAGEVDGLAGRKEAFAERVRFVVSPDAASTRSALLARQIDVFHNVPMSGIEDFVEAEGIAVDQSPTLGWSVLLLQTRDPLLQDVRVRQAIAYAIDRDMVAAFNTYGYASVNSSSVPVGMAAHTPVHDLWYEPDTAKARALLKDAGYGGQPIRIQANRKYQNMYANAVVIQAMLHAAGMNAHIDVTDWASQLSNYFAGKFQLSTFSFSALANPALRYYKLIGSKDRRPVYQWEHPRAIELLEEVIGTSDEAEQLRRYEQLHRLMIEDVPIIGLYNAHSATAMLDTVRDYRPTPLNLPRLWGVWKSDWHAAP
jgi:peptide/nickel transport system substrate-binding protein